MNSNMEMMNDLEMPNRETQYFFDKIQPWIAKQIWANSDHTVVKVIFKHDTPTDIINRFLICRVKMHGIYSHDYEIEGE